MLRTNPPFTTRLEPLGRTSTPAMAVAMAALLAASAPLRAQDEPAQRLLDRAIAAHGGIAALERARTLLWHGKALVHVGGTDVAIEGDWRVTPPDSARSTTWPQTEGPSASRALVLAGADAYVERGGKREPMTAAFAEHERGQFYLYEVLRLATITGDHVILGALAADSARNPGFRVRQPGRRDVEVYVDRETGRVAHLRNRTNDPGDGHAVLQDLWLSGTVSGGGVRWPKEIKIRWDDKPYFDLSIETFDVAAGAVASAAIAATRPVPAAPDPPAPSPGAPPLATGTMLVKFDVTLPGTPDEIFDAVTGDVSGWWDHSFSAKPYKLYIEPKPGGGFYEIFDAQGNGVRHAVVTYAHRGKLLRMEGPLGLSGMAVTAVHSMTFAAAARDSTTIHFEMHATGEVPAGMQAMVDSTWRHFLVDQFKSYIEAGKHKTSRRGRDH